MEPKFWLDRWKNRDTGFHREDANAILCRFWPTLNLAPGSSVLIPLCGMSQDMSWIAQQGHQVIGVELSEIAVETFFQKNNLTPTRRQHGSFQVWSHEKIELWVGDLFSLPTEVLSKCSAVYDRASLVALPSDLQKSYAQLLISHLPKQAQILLISVTFNQQEMEGPPFSTPFQKLTELFQSSFSIKQLSDEMTLEKNTNLKDRGLTALNESCYRLQKL